MLPWVWMFCGGHSLRGSPVNVDMYPEASWPVYDSSLVCCSQQKHSLLGLTASSEECTVFGTKPLLTPSQPS